MPYTHFRFIAYEVPTATNKADGPVESGYPPGPECPEVPRIPVTLPRLNDVHDDARIRLRRLAAVVDRTATWLSNRMPDFANTLKIFMAPEFYFRPRSLGNDEFKNETYPATDFFHIMDQLDRMFVGPDFKHWLIIPGTALWNQIDVRPRIFRNIAMYIRGGEPQGLTAINKLGASSIDGVTNDPSGQKIFELESERRGHYFEIGGVPCGLEVCLDHLDVPTKRVLKTVLRGWQTESPGKAVSLQLLPAGGMTIQPGSVVAREGGYILRNDGYSGFPHSELRKVQSYYGLDPLGGGYRIERDYLPFDDAARAEFSNENFNILDEFTLQGPERVPAFGVGYPEFEQRVVFYPRCPLP